MEQEAYLVQIEYSLREYMKSHPGLTRNEYRQYADEKARTYAGYLQRNYGLDAGTDERFLKDVRSLVSLSSSSLDRLPSRRRSSAS